VTVSSGTAQSYAFNINAVGSDSAAISHSTAVTFTSQPSQAFDFTLGATPSSQSVAAGQIATYTVAVNPSTGSFPSNVSFSYFGAPAATTCAFNPAQIGAGSGNSVSSFTSSTTAPGVSSSAALVLFTAIPFAGVLWMSKGQRHRSRGIRATFYLFALLSWLVSCGGGLQGNGGGGTGNPGTPPGTYTLTITATAGTVSHSTQVTLTVTR
jgi:hypothetical protein